MWGRLLLAVVIAAGTTAAFAGEPTPPGRARPAPPAAPRPVPKAPASAATASRPAQLAPAAPVPPPSAGAPPADEKVVALRNDRLTVRVTATSLDEILERIVEPSQAEIRGALQAPRTVTADFADVPLQDGLTRLLGAQNFLLTFRDDGRLRSLTLLGGAVEAAGATRVAKTTPETVPPPAVANPDLMQRTVPVTGRIRDLVGDDTATLQQLMDLALRQEDPMVRYEALSAGLNGIDGQADLRGRVIASLQQTDDQALESLLRSIAQERATEIARQVAAISRVPEIRTRVIQLSRQMAAHDGQPMVGEE